MAPLVNAGYQLIIPDHAGHGLSQAATAPFGVANLAQDIHALVQQLGLPKVNLLGVSLGSMVALQLLVDSLDLVDKAIICNSFFDTTGGDFRQMSQSWSQTLRQTFGPLTRFEQTWPVLVSESIRQTAEGKMTYQNWHAQPLRRAGKAWRTWQGG